MDCNTKEPPNAHETKPGAKRAAKLTKSGKKKETETKAERGKLQKKHLVREGERERRRYKSGCSR